MEEERELLAGGRTHKVRILVERRNSVRVSLAKNAVIIRVPRHLSSFEREREVQTMLAWAQEKLLTLPEEHYVKKEYRDKEFLKTNTKIYQLHLDIRTRTKNYSKIIGSHIEFKLSDTLTKEQQQTYISKQLRKMLAKQHHQELVQRVTRLNRMHFDKIICKIKWQYTKSRWGACKIQDKEIQISTKLLLAPLLVLDYVIIHELAHLIEPSHSQRFWNIIRSVDETYKDKKKWLNKYGHTLEI